jgi:18S rRNA (guanine1575-N7)-methyltransferase
MGRGDRPELVSPPDIYYGETEAAKYTANSRMVAIQAALTARALELLALPADGRPRLLLDLGCGSGLSGDALTEAGHHWVGTDIAPAMLAVAAAREVEGDLLRGDLGHGLPFRPGTFDGAVSISAVQWLCHADTTAADPRKRLKRFFESLYACLTRGARAVLQVYPDGPDQAALLVGAAMRAGFGGGLVVDYPHSTRAKKHYLVLMVGGGNGGSYFEGGEGVPAPLEGGSDEEEAAVRVAGRSRRRGGGGKDRAGGSGSARHPDAKGGRAWVLGKKDRMRARGYDDLPGDSKYSGRKRRARF